MRRVIPSNLTRLWRVTAKNDTSRTDDLIGFRLHVIRSEAHFSGAEGPASAFRAIPASPAIRSERFTDQKPTLRDQPKLVATAGRSAFDGRPMGC